MLSGVHFWKMITSSLRVLQTFFAISDFFCAPELILFLNMSKSQKHSKASFLKKKSSLKCVFFS